MVMILKNDNNSAIFSLAPMSDTFFNLFRFPVAPYFEPKEIFQIVLKRHCSGTLSLHGASQQFQINKVKQVLSSYVPRTPVFCS